MDRYIKQSIIDGLITGKKNTAAAKGMADRSLAGSDDHMSNYLRLYKKQVDALNRIMQRSR